MSWLESRRGLGIEIIETVLGVRAIQLSTDAAGFHTFLHPPSPCGSCGYERLLIVSRSNGLEG